LAELFTVSKKRNRVYPRKFDWDEAARLRSEGWTFTQIAHHFGVTVRAVRRAVIPHERASDEARKQLWQKGGVCVDCGTQVSRIRKDDERRCRECEALRQATNVRATELRCGRCREWKPDDEFPFNRTGAKTHRGRHDSCRVCQTVLRADYRRRNREKERAYERAYRRQRRLAKMTPLQRATSRLGQKAA
jgi:hypothetical protein